MILGILWQEIEELYVFLQQSITKDMFNIS